MDEDAVTAIVRELAAYLRANPLACDAASAIAGWWLQTDEPVSMKTLARALDWMKQQGAIEELAGPDGRVRYRRSGADDVLDAAVAARAGLGSRRGGR